MRALLREDHHVVLAVDEQDRPGRNPADDPVRLVTEACLGALQVVFRDLFESMDLPAKRRLRPVRIVF